jgi:hypothetical protein
MGGIKCSSLAIYYYEELLTAIVFAIHWKNDDIVIMGSGLFVTMTDAKKKENNTSPSVEAKSVNDAS